jgi:WD40 repeat protein
VRRDYRTVQLWEVATGTPAGPPLRQPEEVLTQALSPNGKVCLTGGLDGVARLWDTRTGKLLTKPLRHDGPVTAAAFSSDGKLALTAGSNRGPFADRSETDLLALLDPTPKKETPGSHPKRADPVMVRRWDVATGEPVGAPLPHAFSVRDLGFGPGNVVWTLDEDENEVIRLWDAAAARVLREFRSQYPVRAVALSPDGKTLLTGGGYFQRVTPGSGMAKLWDTATGKPVGKPLNYSYPVTAVAFRPDGRVVLIHTWNADTSLELACVGGPGGLVRQAARFPAGQVLAAAFTPDGKTILTAVAGAVGKIQLTSGIFKRKQEPVLIPLPVTNYVLSRWSVAGGKPLHSHAGLPSLPGAAAPVQGSVERAQRWAEVVTGMEVRDGAIYRLPSREWRKRLQRLEELGGPPLSRGDK